MSDKETLARAIDTGMRQWAAENSVVVTSKMRQEMSDAILSALRASTQGGEEIAPALAQLREAYRALARGPVPDQRQLAEGLIAPAIRRLEAAALSSAPSIRDQVIEECARALREAEKDLVAYQRNATKAAAYDMRWEGVSVAVQPTIDLIRSAVRSLSTKPTAGEGWSQAVRDVLAERRRQVEAEGWTPEHDDEHSNGEMALAAACYAMPSTARSIPFLYGEDSVRKRLWPWDITWWKPKSRREDLVRAVALGIAEIERLDRAAAPAAPAKGE